MNISKAALIGVGAAAVLALSIGLVSAQGTPGTPGTDTTTTGHCAGDVTAMREHMDSVHGEGSFDSMWDDMGTHMNDGTMGQGTGGHMNGGTGGSGGMMTW